MMARPWGDRYLELFDEATARKVGKIIGEGSACRLALAELARRRAAGEEACLYKDSVNGVIVVGPPQS